jgi:hypothetical protein
MKLTVESLLPAVTILLCIPANIPAYAATFNLQFTGEVDGDGYTVGGVAAPLGSPFTLDVTLDDAPVDVGDYEITALSYHLTTGSYTTATDWAAIGMFTASSNGVNLDLATDPEFQNPDEHLRIDLTGVNGVPDDPRTWTTGNTITGDIIVRGMGGFSSLDMLSGEFPYQGTLSLSLVPEPSTLVLAVGALLLGMLTSTRQSLTLPIRSVFATRIDCQSRAVRHPFRWSRDVIK